MKGGEGGEREWGVSWGECDNLVRVLNAIRLAGGTLPLSGRSETAYPTSHLSDARQGNALSDSTAALTSRHRLYARCATRCLCASDKP